MPLSAGFLLLASDFVTRSEKVNVGCASCYKCAFCFCFSSEEDLYIVQIKGVY